MQFILLFAAFLLCLLRNWAEWRFMWKGFSGLVLVEFEVTYQRFKTERNVHISSLPLSKTKSLPLSPLHCKCHLEFRFLKRWKASKLINICQYVRSWAPPLGWSLILRLSSSEAVTLEHTAQNRGYCGVHGNLADKDLKFHRETIRNWELGLVLTPPFPCLSLSLLLFLPVSYTHTHMHTHTHHAACLSKEPYNVYTECTWWCWSKHSWSEQWQRFSG